MVKQFVKKIIILNIIFALIMSIYRVIFIFYYSSWAEFSKYSIDCLFQTFIMGFKYDCVILAYINLPVTLVLVIFWFIENQKFFIQFIKSLKYYYTVFFGLILTIFCVDFVFYHYFKCHINYLIFELRRYDISYLWYISKNEHLMFFIMFFFVAFCSIYVFFISKIILENSNNLLLRRKFLLIFIIGISCYFILKPTKDDFYKNIVINNPIFELYYTISKHGKLDDYIKKYGYEGKIEYAFSDYLDTDISLINKNNPKISLFKTTKYDKNIEEIQPNVILIIAESLGMNLMQYNSDKFNVLGELKKHFDEDIVFYNCLYSEDSTSCSVFQIITAMLLNHENYDYVELYYMASSQDYEDHKISAYRDNGYKIIGKRADMYDAINFDEDREYCLYNDGILYDEDILDDVFESLHENEENKKIIFALTVTNHSPFDIPKNYKLKNYSVPDDIKDEFDDFNTINAYQYSCQKLGEFLTKLKKSKYADNTIVAIIGDHCYRGLYNRCNYLTLKSVPFYLYIPDKLKPKKELIDTSRVVSNIDVMPTLIELSLSDTTYYSLGRSVFDKNYQNAISSNYDNAIIVNGNDMCFYNVNSDEIKNYKVIREKNKLAKYEETEQTQKHRKMIKQYKSAMAITDYMLYNDIRNPIKNWKNKQND